MDSDFDKYKQFVWVRAKDRLDSGIPLPVKSGSSSTFYLDFLWWVKETVWAIDPTGKFIFMEKVRTKLLTLPPPLKIALLTRGSSGPSIRVPVTLDGVYFVSAQTTPDFDNVKRTHQTGL